MIMKKRQGFTDKYESENLVNGNGYIHFPFVTLFLPSQKELNHLIDIGKGKKSLNHLVCIS